MEGVNIDYVRQAGIVPPSALNIKVAVIGCGGIGSPVALALAKMGVLMIDLYDDDKVEPHNLPNQLYRIKDIGRYKAFALKSILAEYNAQCEVKAIQTKFDATTPTDARIVIVAVDSMAARTSIWQAIDNQEKKPALLIDGRMGGQAGLIETVVMDNPDGWKRYEDTLYSDEGAVQAPCTERAIIYTVFEMAAKICKVVQSFVTGNGVPNTISFGYDPYAQYIE